MKGIALVVIALAGCNLKLTAGGVDAPPVGSDELQWTGTLLDVTQQPIPNAMAQVCVPGHPEIACAQADDTGAWTLVLPVPVGEENVPVLASAMGYTSDVGLGLIAAPGIGTRYPSGFALEAEDLERDQLATCGFTYPDEVNGFAFLAVRTPPGMSPAGATVTITPAGTPVYAGSGGAYDPSLTMTSDSGEVMIGHVPPGPVQITVTLPSLTCDLGGSNGAETDGDWPSAGAETLDAYVAANAITQGLSVICH